jgi:hypothetical protein
MENSSREYSYSKIKAMIERQTEKYGWEFIFLGANIDAVATAGRFGIAEDRAADFCSDGDGTALNFDVISETVSRVRSNNRISENWKEKIDKDYQKRGKRRS